MLHVARVHFAIAEPTSSTANVGAGVPCSTLPVSVHATTTRAVACNGQGCHVVGVLSGLHMHGLVIELSGSAIAGCALHYKLPDACLNCSCTYQAARLVG